MDVYITKSLLGVVKRVGKRIQLFLKRCRIGLHDREQTKQYRWRTIPLSFRNRFTSMYRFKFTIPDSTMRVRYGALQAEALTSGWIDRTVYLVSENSLYFAEVVVGVFHQR